jgi:hypothetical protein
MKPLDVIITSVIAYVIANTFVNVSGQAEFPSPQYVFPFAVSVVVAFVGLFVSTHSANRSTRQSIVTGLRDVAVVICAALLVSTISGKLLALVLFGLIPFQAWRFARAWLPAHTWLLTFTAFGLVITLVSRGLFSLLFVSFLFPLGLRRRLPLSAGASERRVLGTDLRTNRSLRRSDANLIGSSLDCEPVECSATSRSGRLIQFVVT